jgi:hypothetical protein
MTADELKGQLNLGASLLMMNSELKEIAKMLYPNETVGKGATGSIDGKTGLIVATNKRVIFVSKVLFSSKVEEFNYSKISTVEISSTLMAEMTILFSGSRIKIHSMGASKAKALAEYIKLQINAPAEATVANIIQPSKSEPDAFEQIEKLAKLKDQGIITDEEFTAKKKQLLGL